MKKPLYYSIVLSDLRGEQATIFGLQPQLVPMAYSLLILILILDSLRHLWLIYVSQSKDMAITFGSVGDIIVVCQIVQSIVKALDDSRGSASEFRQLMRSLSSLAQALQQTQELVKYQNHITNGEVVGSQG